MLYLLPDDDDELLDELEELDEEDPEDEGLDETELELDEPDEKLLDEEDEDLVAGAEDLGADGAGADDLPAELGAALPTLERGAGAAVPLLWFGLLVLYDGLVLILELS